MLGERDLIDVFARRRGDIFHNGGFPVMADGGVDVSVFIHLFYPFGF